MPCSIEVLLTPSEFPTLRERDLSDTVCVVFDVLRATSVIVTALSNGAAAVIPVEQISEALAIRKARPEVLLGGERGGLRIRASQGCGVDFDFGNSPRDYTRSKVSGKTIVTTTTNGTRALRACAGSKRVIAAAFLNLAAVTEHVSALHTGRLALVCAGTEDDAALEDVLAAGALCDLLISRLTGCTLEDSAAIAHRAYCHACPGLEAVLKTSRNARRLLANPELAGDVEFCLQQDVFLIVPELRANGEIRGGN